MTTSCATNSTPSVCQHTVQQSAQWRTDRHRRRTDMLVVHPADADTGVRFQRHGTVSASGIIPAHWDAVVDTRGGIVLGNSHGTTLRGAIPLLAALRVSGIDNAIVEVHGTRIPDAVSDFDMYLDMLADAGVQAQAAARRLLCITDAVEVRDSFGVVTLSPASGFRASVNMTTTEPGGNSDAAYAALVSDFTEATTGPGMLNERPLTEAGDASAARPLREIRTLPIPLRSTLIEMIGHLALTGPPVAGTLRAHNSGSKLYQSLLHAVMDSHVVTHSTVDAHRAQHRTTAHAVAGAVEKSDCGNNCLC